MKQDISRMDDDLDDLPDNLPSSISPLFSTKISNQLNIGHNNSTTNQYQFIPKRRKRSFKKNQKRATPEPHDDNCLDIPSPFESSSSSISTSTSDPDSPIHSETHLELSPNNNLFLSPNNQQHSVNSNLSTRRLKSKENLESIDLDIDENNHEMTTSPDLHTDSSILDYSKPLASERRIKFPSVFRFVKSNGNTENTSHTPIPNPVINTSPPATHRPHEEPESTNSLHSMRKEILAKKRASFENVVEETIERSRHHAKNSTTSPKQTTTDEGNRRKDRTFPSQTVGCKN